MHTSSRAFGILAAIPAAFLLQKAARWAVEASLEGQIVWTHLADAPGLHPMRVAYVDSDARMIYGLDVLTNARRKTSLLSTIRMDLGGSPGKKPTASWFLKSAWSRSQRAATVNAWRSTFDSVGSAVFVSKSETEVKHADSATLESAAIDADDLVVVNPIAERSEGCVPVFNLERFIRDDEARAWDCMASRWVWVRVNGRLERVEVCAMTAQAIVGWTDGRATAGLVRDHETQHSYAAVLPRMPNPAAGPFRINVSLQAPLFEDLDEVPGRLLTEEWMYQEEQTTRNRVARAFRLLHEGEDLQVEPQYLQHQQVKTPQ